MQTISIVFDHEHGRRGNQLLGNGLKTGIDFDHYIWSEIGYDFQGNHETV